jgi:hypothetical protein
MRLFTGSTAVLPSFATSILDPKKNSFRLSVLIDAFAASSTPAMAQSDTTPPTLTTLCFGSS